MILQVGSLLTSYAIEIAKTSAGSKGLEQSLRDEDHLVLLPDF